MPPDAILISADEPTRQLFHEVCERLHLVSEVRDDDRFIEDDSIDQDPSVFVIDLDAVGGIEGFSRFRQRWPRVPTLLVAQRAHAHHAIVAMKQGVIDYLFKPLQREAFINRLTDALRISRDMSSRIIYEAEPPDPSVDRIIGESHAMQDVFKRIGLIAPRDVNVLITGESGTGKEIIARAIYHHSARKDRTFVAVNCAAIPETLLESELFGHEKGAFTGADMKRIGKFEQCDGGTLFLDEIGDLPLQTQAKLLRVLQDGSFQRLGGTETLHANVRIIAATNQPLDKLMAERRFRQDLYYRLQVTTIEIPPLRERGVDSVLLAHYFVRRFNVALGTDVRNFSPTVLPALLAYPWPGNVRELENVIKSSLVMARGHVFEAAYLPEHIREAHKRWAVPDADRGSQDLAGQAGTLPETSSAMNRATPQSVPEPGNPASGTSPETGPSPPIDLRTFCQQLADNPAARGRVFEEAVQRAECEAIRAALLATGGKLAAAAELLGITRTTLRRKMQAYHITLNATVNV